MTVTKATSSKYQRQIKICPSNMPINARLSQTMLHRMHIMILIREQQQKHYAGLDESAVR